MAEGEPVLNPEHIERVLKEIKEEEVIAFLQTLVRVPSVNPPGDVREAIQVCQDKLAAEAFATEIMSRDDTKPNLVARLSHGEGPTLLFNAHVDVVPTGEESAWSHPPFGAEIADGRVYGRGAGDDKGSVTAQVMSAVALARAGVPLRGTLIINEVADEEVGGQLGAAMIASQPSIHPDFVIVGEQTLNRVCLGEKGSAGTQVTVFGRTAHGALPWEGANAVEGMARIITALQDELWPKLEQRTHRYFHHSSASVNIIEGGVKNNVVPDRCSIYIDRRLVPDEQPEEVVAEIREIAERIIASLPGLRVVVEPRGNGGRPATLNPPDSPVVEAMLAANRKLGLNTEPTGFSMATDGRFFAEQGYPTIIYGPGDPSLAHKPDEWVGIDEVMEATRAYALAAIALLGA